MAEHPQDTTFQPVQGGTIDPNGIRARILERNSEQFEALLQRGATDQQLDELFNELYAEEVAALQPQEAPSTEGLSAGELFEQQTASGGFGGEGISGADELLLEQQSLRLGAEREAGSRAPTIFEILQQSSPGGPTSFNLGGNIGDFPISQFNFEDIFGGGSDDFGQFKSAIIDPPLERTRAPFSDPNGPQAPPDFNSAQRSSAGGLNFGPAGNHLKTIRDILGI